MAARGTKSKRWSSMVGFSTVGIRPLVDHEVIAFVATSIGRDGKAHTEHTLSFSPVVKLEAGKIYSIVLSVQEES